MEKNYFYCCCPYHSIGWSSSTFYDVCFNETGAATTSGTELKRYVKAETVNYDEIISPLSREGRVVSSSEVALVAEAAGKIEKGDVNLRKGASFKKGHLLAEIYKDEVELALKARKSGFLNYNNNHFT